MATTTRKYLIVALNSCGLFLLSSATFQAQAADLWWVCGNGLWDDNCWSSTPGGTPDVTGTPGINDTAYLYNSSMTDITIDVGKKKSPHPQPYFVNIDAIGSGTMTLTQSTGDLSMGVNQIGIAGSGAVLLTGGSRTTGLLRIGVKETGSGTYTVSGDTTTLDITNSTTIGSSGSGRLDIQAGAMVTSNLITLATTASSSGMVTIDGPGSTWTGWDINVGWYGHGVLNILNGGTFLTDYTVNVGRQTGGSGVVTVDGADSSWTMAGRMYLGNEGSGELNIRNGGTVSGTISDLGLRGTGTATVAGVGSSWTLSESLRLNGGSSINIQDGGSVNAGSISIGSSGNPGTITVDGAGSSLISNNGLSVHGAGGLLNIRNGGTAINNIGFLGYASSSANTNGTAIIDGIGSSWTNNGNLYIGRSAVGHLNIHNGGTVSNVDGYLGARVTSLAPAGEAAVTIDGEGSTWTNSGSLYVAGNETSAMDTGVLNVTNQGTVFVGDNLVMWNEGRIHVDTGSAINVTGNYIQNAGETIANGIISASSAEFLSGQVSGSGTIAADVLNTGAQFGPGNSTGTLSIDGDYTQGVSALLNIEVSGLLPSEYDVLDVFGSATLDPGTTIHFSFINDFLPASGDAFDFLAANILTADLDLIAFSYSGLNEGFLFDIAGNNGVLSFTALNDGTVIVPVPAAAWLFGSGLLGLVAAAKRKNAS